MKRFTLLYLFLFFILGSSFGQLKPQIKPLPKKTRLLFVLDGSGSMRANWEGKTRMQIAKKALSNIVDSLKVNKNVELGLRVYGHQFDRKYQNCQDSKLEVSFGANSHDNIINKLKTIQPQGVTPISISLEKAANDFPKDPNYRNVIIIITDGLESCGGDPCAVSQALQKKHIFLQPFIVGIGMTNKDAKQFDCLGTFYNAKSVKQFSGILSNIVSHSLSAVNVRIDLLDINKKATETNVNVQFVNSLTGQTEYDFIHYIKNGKPDIFEVDPVITYDIVVNTTPKVIKKNVRFPKKGLNVVKINTPQGSLQFNQGSHQQYKQLLGIVKKAGSNEILHHFMIGEVVPLIVGEYDIEIMTIPRIKKRVKIQQSRLNKIQLKTPGILNITDSFKGFGSIYKINPNGNEEWVLNLPKKSVNLSTAMQPGNFKVVVRSANAEGVIYTITKKFTINPGASTRVRLL